MLPLRLVLVVLLVLGFAFLLLFLWIAARVILAQPATVAEARMVVFSTWAWTKGSGARLMASLFLLVVGSIFPVKWMAQGFRSVLLPPEMVVFEPAGSWEHGRTLLMLTAWSVIGLLCCLRVFRWSDTD